MEILPCISGSCGERAPLSLLEVATGPDGRVIFEHRDGGICNVCSFEKLLGALSKAGR